MKQKINAIIVNLIIIFVSVLTCDKIVQTNMCNYFIRTDGSYNLINIIALYTAIFIFVVSFHTYAKQCWMKGDDMSHKIKIRILKISCTIVQWIFNVLFSLIYTDVVMLRTPSINKSLYYSTPQEQIIHVALISFITVSIFTQVMKWILLDDI